MATAADGERRKRHDWQSLIWTLPTDDGQDGGGSHFLRFPRYRVVGIHCDNCFYAPRYGLVLQLVHVMFSESQFRIMWLRDGRDATTDSTTVEDFFIEAAESPQGGVEAAHYGQREDAALVFKGRALGGEKYFGEVTTIVSAGRASVPSAVLVNVFCDVTPGGTIVGSTPVGGGGGRGMLGAGRSAAASVKQPQGCGGTCRQGIAGYKPVTFFVVPRPELSMKAVEELQKEPRYQMPSILRAEVLPCADAKGAAGKHFGLGVLREDARSTDWATFAVAIRRNEEEKQPLKSLWRRVTGDVGVSMIDETKGWRLDWMSIDRSKRTVLTVVSTSSASLSPPMQQQLPRWTLYVRSIAEGLHLTDTPRFEGTLRAWPTTNSDNSTSTSWHLLTRRAFPLDFLEEFFFVKMAPDHASFASSRHNHYGSNTLLFVPNQVGCQEAEDFWSRIREVVAGGAPVVVNASFTSQGGGHSSTSAIIKPTNVEAVKEAVAPVRGGMGANATTSTVGKIEKHKKDSLIILAVEGTDAGSLRLRSWLVNQRDASGGSATGGDTTEWCYTAASERGSGGMASMTAGGGGGREGAPRVGGDSPYWKASAQATLELLERRQRSILSEQAHRNMEESVAAALPTSWSPPRPCTLRVHLVVYRALRLIGLLFVDTSGRGDRKVTNLHRDAKVLAADAPTVTMLLFDVARVVLTSTPSSRSSGAGSPPRAPPTSSGVNRTASSSAGATNLRFVGEVVFEAQIAERIVSCHLSPTLGASGGGSQAYAGIASGGVCNRAPGDVRVIEVHMFHDARILSPPGTHGTEIPALIRLHSNLTQSSAVSVPFSWDEAWKQIGRYYRASSIATATNGSSTSTNATCTYKYACCMDLLQIASRFRFPQNESFDKLLRPVVAVFVDFIAWTPSVAGEEEEIRVQEQAAGDERKRRQEQEGVHRTAREEGISQHQPTEEEEDVGAPEATQARTDNDDTAPVFGMGGIGQDVRLLRYLRTIHMIDPLFLAAVIVAVDEACEMTKSTVNDRAKMRLFRDDGSQDTLKETPSSFQAAAPEGSYDGVGQLCHQFEQLLSNAVTEQHRAFDGSHLREIVHQLFQRAILLIPRDFLERRRSRTAQDSPSAAEEKAEKY